MIRSEVHRRLFVVKTAIAIGLCLLAVGDAFAHSKMNASIPADGATVTAQLKQIELEFSVELRLMLAKIARLDQESAKDVALKPIPKAFAKHAILPVPGLDPGQYRVIWTGVGRDGHVMSGSFKFIVKPE
jgi:copper resistance protein C